MSRRSASITTPADDDTPPVEVRWGSLLNPERNAKGARRSLTSSEDDEAPPMIAPAAKPKPMHAPEPAPRDKPVVLVVDDDESVRHTFKRIFREMEITVLAADAAGDALEIIEKERPDVVVLDIILPDESGLRLFQQVREIDAKAPVIFITAGGTSETAIEAMKLGAYDYLLKPLDFQQVRSLVTRAIEIRRMMRVPVGFDQSQEVDDSVDALVGKCEAMQEVYKAIGRVAPQNVTVLIRGESGTGKELVARALYHHSQRASGPFLAVNCAAIPETLLESELFGHEKGAFTGADTKRIGKFEQCSGGTIFLDEIGDMTPLVQSKVLRLLQEQKFERVGGNETVTTDVRIIAATHRDLEKMVADGEFRADLYYRLNGFMIHLPPLRERQDDILLLLERFIQRASRELGKTVQGVAPEAIETLKRYTWPGNVRELQSVVKQALLHATSPILAPDFLPEHIRQGAEGVKANGGTATEKGAWEALIEERMRAGSQNLYAEALESMERTLIARVLRHTEGNQSHAAKMLGITRGSLRNKIRALGISIGQVVSLEDD